MPFVPALSVITSVYKGESYLEAFFKNLRSQTLFPELELVLVLNAPSVLENDVAENFAKENGQQIQIIQIDQLETLGASWNRAWAAAKASYLAIWNIDDRRLPDSLSNQLTTLEEHSDWFLSYGDYVAVKSYGDTAGQERHTPIYKPSVFRRSFAQGGAFWVFRRHVSDQIGYFDEQFIVGPDMDFSFRMAAKGLAMGRTERLLGYFTNAAQGLSTRDGALQSAIERTAIQLRYGVFDKVRDEFENASQQYKLDSVLTFGDWHPLTEYLPDYEKFLQSRRHLKVFGGLRNNLRSLLRRLNLLELIYRLQQKYLKREV